MSTVHIIVRPRSAGNPRPPLPLDLDPSTTIAQLRKEIASAWRIAPVRQRITLEKDSKTVLEDDDKTIKDYGMSKGTVVLVKDLGAQVAWKTMFILEYIGPILIHPIFYHGSQLIYGKTFQHSKMQTMAYAMIIAHFIKRELETFFVHRFSKATMPAYRLAMNPPYYWIISGIVLSYPIYGPWNSAPALRGTLRGTPEFLWPVVGFWLWAQASNLWCHLHLASLRPPGTKTRKIPRGYAFETVSCANYTFESLGWLAIAVLTQSIVAWGWWVALTYVMYNWALARHRRYKKEFGKDYPARRRAMFPGLP